MVINWITDGMIPIRGIGIASSGQSWSAYWTTLFATLQSVTVETAAPNNIVMTFTKADTKMLATDLTVTDHTISSITRSLDNKVITIVLSTPILYFDTNLFVNFSNHGYISTQAITNNVADDGNTMFYDDARKLSTLTKSDISIYERVSQIADVLASGRDLKMSNDVGKPRWSFGGGLYGDGINHAMKADAFTWNQPETIYILFKQLSWESNGLLFDGNANASAIWRQKAGGASPQMEAYAGASSAAISDLAIGSWGIAVIKFNGASSSVQINDNAAWTGNLGAANAGGFTLFTLANYTLNGNYEVLAIIGRKTADSDATIASIKKAIKRKYSGVWELQGNVMTPEVSEDSLCGEPTVLYEGNAQILETTGSVFKMWYTANWDAAGTYYAESLDGKAWTKYSDTPVIASCSRNCVIKVGSLYYAYVHNGVNNLNIDLYTSANGVDFTLHTANILTVGAAGSWDENGIHNTTILLENGTYYMFYDGFDSSANLFNVGLATSSDGITWTKHASNPVIASTYTRGSSHIMKVGSKYYIWCLGNERAGTLPSDFYRYVSDDLVTWAQDVSDYTFYRTEADEGYQSIVGQVADPFLLEYDGKVYMYYCGSSNGNLKTGNYHIKLAIADMTLAQLVKTNEKIKIATL